MSDIVLTADGIPEPTAAALPALRGAAWDGIYRPTLRLDRRAAAAAQPGTDRAQLVLPGELTDPQEIVRRYRDYLTTHGTHPTQILHGEALVIAGPAADRLGEAIPAAAPSDGHNPDGGASSDPVVDAALSRSAVMTDRVAIVTGGAQGFGYEIARGLAAAGAQVVVADLNADGARDAADRLIRTFGRAVHSAVRVDVSSDESVAAMFDAVAAAYGGVDLVVSNAGVLKAGSVKELPVKDFEFVTKVNYEGFFLVSKHAARLLERQNQAAGIAHPDDPMLTDIIEINSKSGLVGSNKNGAYAGSKFGGIGLVQSFAMELMEDNVKVNAICPGNFFDGPLWSDPDRGLFVQYLNTGKVPGARTVADVRRAYEAKVPMKRGCEGADVIRAILYVVEQRYETGQAVPVTGGQEMLR